VKDHLHLVFSAGYLEYLTIVKFQPYLIIIKEIKVYYLIRNLSMFEKEVVIDGRGHLVGRLASKVAKELQNGQRIVVVRCEALLKSGSLFRNKLKFHEFLQKTRNTNPRGTYPLQNSITHLLESRERHAPTQDPQGLCRSRPPEGL